MTDVRNIELHYIGGDGRENRPHPLMYGESVIFTPPLGEAFPIKFTELEAHRLIKNSAFTNKGKVYYSVTRDARVAKALKAGRTLDEVINNVDSVTLSDEQLLAELAKRGIAVPVEEEKTAPKRATKKEVTENG